MIVLPHILRDEHGFVYGYKSWVSLHPSPTSKRLLPADYPSIASYTAITAVTAYAPILLASAHYSAVKQNGLAGGVSSIGIVGTIISSYVVDRFGRRRCLIWGAAGMVIVNAIAGGLYEASRDHPNKAVQIAPAAVTMLFLFNRKSSPCVQST